MAQTASVFVQVLSKNEIGKEDKHNRKLFFRVMREGYLFNPKLSLKIEGEWIHVYDLLSIDRLATRREARQEGWRSDDHAAREENMAQCKRQLKALVGKTTFIDPV